MRETLNEIIKRIVEEADPDKIKKDTGIVIISRQYLSKANRNRKIQI